jgi:hypothetical protein
MCERRGLALDLAESEAHRKAFRFLRRHETSHFDGVRSLLRYCFRNIPSNASPSPGAPGNSNG